MQFILAHPLINKKYERQITCDRTTTVQYTFEHATSIFISKFTLNLCITNNLAHNSLSEDNDIQVSQLPEDRWKPF